MANQALLNAVNKAIEALEEVKRELEREDTIRQEDIETVAPSAPKGAFCMNCGAPLKPGDKFCMKCGTRV